MKKNYVLSGDDTHTHTVYAEFHMATDYEIQWRWRVKRRRKKTARKTLRLLAAVHTVSIGKKVHTRKNRANTLGGSVLLFYLVFDKFGCAQLNDWWWHCFKFFIKSQNVKSHVVFCPFLCSNTHTRTGKHRITVRISASNFSSASFHNSSLPKLNLQI